MEKITPRHSAAFGSRLKLPAVPPRRDGKCACSEESTSGGSLRGIPRGALLRFTRVMGIYGSVFVKPKWATDLSLSLATYRE
jgi:hypothetical protein